jgi:hypothetical protein
MGIAIPFASGEVELDEHFPIQQFSFHVGSIRRGYRDT